MSGDAMSERTVMQLAALLTSAANRGSHNFLLPQELSALREAADLLTRMAELTASANRARLTSARMSSRDQLLLWTGDDSMRQNVAAYAEQTVCSLHSDVERGSEQFYSLVLAEALRR
jgi:hypothetical protein